MAADLPDHKPYDPDAVAAKSFSTVRRGYEPDEVRAFLLSVASSMRDAKLRYDDMERRLVEVERRAADPKDLDEDAVTQLLGEETARVLETARKAAADIRSRAEQAAVEQEAAITERDRLTREAADEYSSAVRTTAEEADRRIRADADRYAEEVRSAADAETAAQRAAADEYDQRVRGAADTEVASLREAAVAEAERLRTEAASILTERTAEAEVAASAILGEADGYSTRVRSDADRYSEATRAAADSYRSDTHAGADAYKADAVAEGDRLRQEAIDEGRRIREEAEAAAAASAEASEAAAQAALDAAREQGRQMVEEARTYRERVIADLADRRRTARGQLDAIAATRDALAVALSDVGSGLASSQRLLDDLDIDSSLLGDVATDRAVLEAGDVDHQPSADGAVADGDAPAGFAGGALDEVDAVVVDGGTGAGGTGVGDEASGQGTDAGLSASDELEAAAGTEGAYGPEGGDGPEGGEAAAAGDGDVDHGAPAGDAAVEVGAAATGGGVEADRGAGVDAEPEGGASVAEADEVGSTVLDGGPGGPEVEGGDVSSVEPTGSTEEHVPSGSVDGAADEAEDHDPEPVVDPAGVEPSAEGPPGGGDAVGGGGSDVDALDLREGRIDQIFAKIRADRQEEPGDEPVDRAEVEDPAVEATSSGDVAEGGDDGQGRPEAGPGVDADADLLDRRDAALIEVEKQLARKLKRVLADEQNETLDLLRRTKGAPTAEGVLPAESDHHERYRGAALEDLAAAERVGAGFFATAPDRHADVFDVAGDFAGEILRQIRGQLVRAIDDGGDEYELGDRIRSCYREWKTQRIADTARHFVIVAFSRGVSEAAVDGTSFRWLLDDGDQPCPDCDDNQLGGAVGKGDPFPTGDLCPPAHPGCRCMAVPVP